jgi:hypothetical protein
MASPAPSIEINTPPNRLERAFEIIPGLLTWGFFIGIIVASFALPTLTAYVVIGFDLLWLGKSFGMSRRMIQGYSRLHRYSRLHWNDWLAVLSDFVRTGELPEKRQGKQSQWFLSILRHNQDKREEMLDPLTVYHGVIIALVNEPLDVIEPTIQSLIDADYDAKRLIVFIAYEAAGGPQTEKNVQHLVKKYQEHFFHMDSSCHVKKSAEVIGKGSNITNAGRDLLKWVKGKGIDTSRVIVTSLDCDNRPDKVYFAYLMFVYCLLPDRKYKAYQPISTYYDNIWDVPAPMRLIAVGNTFWTIIESMRPHKLRNFASHAQSLDALVETDFWSVKTVVEDGHQYWRSYFTFSGRYEVVPLHVSISRDAVLAEGYARTFKAQFIQIRRWAWGVTDISYVVSQSLKHPEISWLMRLGKLLRLIEGHFSWATAPLLLALAGWLPLVLNPASDQNIIAHQLPVIASNIQMVATLGIVISIFLTLLSLPPRPARYRRHRTIGMLLQWVLLPVTTICFGALAAIVSQTRLMFGRYLTKFDLTEKAVKK